MAVPTCPIHPQYDATDCPLCGCQDEYLTGDPYDAIPFGDAQRFEDNAVFDDIAAGEGREFESEDFSDE